LYCASDPFDPKRDGSKIVPLAADIPEKYRHLLQWHRDWCRGRSQLTSRFNSLLALEGSGRDLWAGEHTDEYIDRLREGWE